MLGDQIVIEEKGKVIVVRVLSAEGKMEESFTGTGKLNGGIKVTDTGTFTAVPRPDGSLHGEGQGVVTTVEGEMATYSGRGVGRFTGPGKISYRYSLVFQTPSTGKLAFLNNMVVVGEFNVDMNTQDYSNKSWEWK